MRAQKNIKRAQCLRFESSIMLQTLNNVCGTSVASMRCSMLLDRGVGFVNGRDITARLVWPRVLRRCERRMVATAREMIISVVRR